MGVVFSTIQTARVIDALIEGLRWPLASLASAARRRNLDHVPGNVNHAERVIRVRTSARIVIKGSYRKIVTDAGIKLEQ